MRLTITLKLKNDRGDILETTTERDFTEYEDGNHEEAMKFGNMVVEDLEKLVKLHA